MAGERVVPPPTVLTSSQSYNTEPQTEDEILNDNNIYDDINEIPLNPISDLITMPTIQILGCNLSVGDHVDVFDSAGYWCEAEVRNQLECFQYIRV